MQNFSSEFTACSDCITFHSFSFPQGILWKSNTGSKIENWHDWKWEKPSAKLLYPSFYIKSVNWIEILNCVLNCRENLEDTQGKVSGDYKMNIQVQFSWILFFIQRRNITSSPHPSTKAFDKDEVHKKALYQFWRKADKVSCSSRIVWQFIIYTEPRDFVGISRAIVVYRRTLFPRNNRTCERG